MLLQILNNLPPPPYLTCDSTELYVYINKRKYQFDLDRIISDQFRYDPFSEDYEPLPELLEFVWKKIENDTLPKFLKYSVKDLQN